MSEVTITMCDIEDCRAEAVERYDFMQVSRQENGDGAFKVYTLTDVDLCGQHEHQYRAALPDMRIKERRS